MRGLLWVLLVMLAGCDRVPRDAAGGIERVRGGELHAGASDQPPWVVLRDGQVRGIEPELIERWAKRLDARVVWRTGSAADLVEALHRRELDVVVAGLDASTPFKPRLALTQPYIETIDRYGKRRKHVMAVTQGESALLLSLDRYLAAQDATALRRRVQSSP